MQEQPTKWSMIASGEGANRIAFLYYARFNNPAIKDRVLLLNTARADVEKEDVEKKTFEYMLSKDPNFKQTFEKIKREKICIFGESPSGAGNNWKVGENEARKDFDNIRRYIANLGLAIGDAILTMGTLGGGTGSGSIPYIVHELKYGKRSVSEGQNKFLSFGILPYDTEANHRHFNTICSLTKLLKFNGKQNADMVILVDNTQIEKSIETYEGGPGEEERYYRINQEIIKAIGLMIAPGGRESKATIDINDLIQLPKLYHCYHFTPCLSLGNNPKILKLKAAFDIAADRPMVPIDPKTATMAYFIVRAPKKYVENKTFAQEGLEEISREWALENMAGKMGGKVRYCSLVPTEEQDTFDVLILLGGFSLGNLLEKSLGGYMDMKVDIMEMQQPSEGEQEVSTIINEDDLKEIDNQLRDYVKNTERIIERAQRRQTKKEPGRFFNTWLKGGREN